METKKTKSRNFYQKDESRCSSKRLAVYFSLLFLAISFNSFAQWPCNYLDDFVPSSTDPVKKVKVIVHRFKPSTGTGVWDGVTLSDVQHCIDVANTTFSSIPAPSLAMSGVTQIPDSKIQLELFAFQTYTDDLAYSTASVAYSGTGNPNGSYYDENAINLFLCEFAPGERRETISLYGTQIDGPKAYIHFGNNVSDNVYSHGVDLAHEVGHMLGLPHTNDPYPVAHFTLSCTSCNSSGTSDYIQVYYTTPMNCAPGISNNLMNWNAGCYEYLSPKQMAIMHYYLMAEKTNWLTQSSYTNVTTAISSINYTVNGTETWTTPRFFKGNIIVPSGSVLNIQCNVAMQNKGKIIVKIGGYVNISGAGKVTNISGRLWEGISVEGNPNVTQQNNFGAHGQLYIMNGGTIENSINGVRNYGHDANGNVAWNSRGGIIYAQDANFINNVRDVEFLSFPINFGNQSRFTNCIFKTTGQINDNNAPYVHVSLFDIKGVTFQSCKFENAAQSIYPNIGQGIHSIDAIYSIDDFFNVQSSFKGFKEGISVSNSNNLRSINVYDSKFDNNFKGIEVSAMKSSILDGNSFTMTPVGAKGIALNNCQLYAVSNNTFVGASNANNGKAGIYSVLSGGTDAHRIYRNNFSNLYLGIVPQFNNGSSSNGLFLNCNTFTGTANGYDIAMLGANNASNLPAAVAQDQGVITNNLNPSQSDPKKLTRNRYGATCVTNGQRKWYIDYTGTQLINHAVNSDAITQPTPQPNCSNTLVSISNSSISFNYGNHCLLGGNRPSSNPNCPCVKCCMYSDISLGLSQALAQTNTLSAYFASTIDGGNTQNLLNVINSGTMTATGLKNYLVSYSPYLSDTVLKTYFGKSSVTPANASAVHNQNRPVTTPVWNTILDRAFTGANMDSMTAHQNLGGISARRSLEGQRNIARSELQFIYSEKINYFLKDTLAGSQDTVIKLLSQNLAALSDAPVQLVNAYANGGYYTRAFAYADSLKSYPKYETRMTLQLALLKLDTAKAKHYKILTDSGLRNTIMTYAADSTKAGSAEARAVLNNVYGTNMNFVYLLPNDDSGSRVIGSLNSSEESGEEGPWKELSSNLKVYPNPTDNTFNLLYTSNSAKDTHYTIMDLLGKEITSGIINPNVSHEINAKTFANGIYFITLIQDNKIVEKQKLVIMK